jgi:hypothetical protein
MAMYRNSPRGFDVFALNKAAHSTKSRLFGAKRAGECRLLLLLVVFGETRSVDARGKGDFGS